MSEVSKLDSVYAVDNQQIFRVLLSDGTYRILFANIDKSNTIENRTSIDNLLSLNPTGKTTVINNIYDSTQQLYKSAVYTSGITAKSGNTYDFNPVTHVKLEDNILTSTMTIVGNKIYGLQNRMLSGYYHIANDVYSYLSNDNGDVVPPASKITHFTLDKDKITDELCLSTASAYKSSFNLKHDCLYEFPGSIQNDYASSNIAANTVILKNDMNHLYSQKHDSTTLLNTRQYTSVDSCNDLLYLKYNDNINVNMTNQSESSTSNTNSYPFENIEVVSKINRFRTLANKKTGMYSIAITTDIINSAGLSDTQRNNVVQQLKNCIKLIVKNITPAHSQLYSIIVNNESVSEK